MFSAGQQIGPYTLVGTLGKGGFGEVWLAERQSQFFTKRVAIKLPHDEQVDFETVKREAVLWEQASGHPNVLPIIDADVYQGQVVIVSEYAEGGSLADKLNTEGRLQIKQAVEMTIGILNGLEFLHSRNIIHRDIKPANILLQGEMPRLADFGISRAMNALTASSVVVGTESYMSPEAFEGKRSVQTDIWSVGAVLYLTLKGNLPFPQGHPSERMFAILTKEFEPLPDELPLKLKEIVQKALAKNPEGRFQSASLMREELQKVLAGISFPQFAPTEILPKNLFSTVSPGAQTFADNQSVVTQTPITPLLETANQVQPTVPSIEPPPAVTEVNQSPSVVTKISARDSDPPSKPRPVPAHKFGDVFVWAIGVGLIIVIIISFILSNYNSKTANSNSKTINTNTNKTTIASNTTTSGNLSNSNNQSENYLKEGRDYYDQKQYDKAIASFSKAIELNPANISGYFYRGLIYHDKTQYDKAIADFARVIKLDPAHSEAYFNRGSAHEAKKQYDKAIENYTKYIELNPLNADGYLQRGYSYSEKGQHDKAIADFSKAIELNPNDSSGYFRRGYSYGEKSQHDKAIADYDKAIELNPDDSTAYNNRGVAYSNKGNNKQAQADWRKALELDPDNKDARDNLKN